MWTSQWVSNQRVKKLAAQYIPPMEVLRKSATALSSLEGPVSASNSEDFDLVMPSLTELPMLDSDLKMVPTTENFDLSLASLAPEAQPDITLVRYKSNTALTNLITTVERRVPAVRSSFLLAEKIVENPPLENCRTFPEHSSLLKERRDINPVFIHICCLYCSSDIV